jgi:polyhydroxybutyrate depolymerase
VFHVGGRALSAEQTAAHFAARNEITEPATTTTLAHRQGSGKTSVIRTDFRQDGKAPVVLYSVHGGGHTVPGPHKAPFVLGRTSRDVNAAEAIGEFFGVTHP